MSAPAPRYEAHVLVLSEDAARDAHETLTALVKKMFVLLVSGCRTNLLEFQPANEESKRVLHGNVWKSDNPRDQRQVTELVRTIARKITEPGASTFVFFHVDGDRVWRERSSCENRRKFEERIRCRVEQLLMRPDVSAAEREAALARLVLVMPFWSIEAWCYQNTRVAIRLCQERHQGADIGLFEAWEQNRAALDELPKPKEVVCLRDHHNRELASDGYPANDVYETGTSFAEVVNSFLTANDLLNALTRTCM